jgi:3-oxoacyl-[acyl-carrier protein] reductase
MTGGSPRLTGKVAVVTGAGRGIGRETALLLAREGACVVVNDLGGGPTGLGGDQSIAEIVAQEIRDTGGQAVAETSSVATMQGGRAVVDAALAAFGRLDILINNAGIIRPQRIDQMSEDDFDLVLAVNLKGYFATIRHAAPHLMTHGGAIVNLSSPSGFGHYSMGNYAAAKEGVIGLTRTVARDLGEFGVRCNAVRPMAGNSAMAIPEVYATITYSIEKLGIPFISNQWLGSGGVEGLPGHVAAVMVWLCTEAAATLNGREIYVAGGHVALIQEPELIRSQFNAAGWDLESLSSQQVTAALTWDQRNRFTGTK